MPIAQFQYESHGQKSLDFNEYFGQTQMIKPCTVLAKLKKNIIQVQKTVHSVFKLTVNICSHTYHNVPDNHQISKNVPAIQFIGDTNIQLNRQCN